MHTESLAVTNPTRRTSQACLQTPSVSIRVCWESGNQKSVRDHFRAGRILNICTMVFCRFVRYDTRSQPEVDKYSLGLALCELNPTLEPKLTVQPEPTQISGGVSDLVTAYWLGGHTRRVFKGIKTSRIENYIMVLRYLGARSQDANT